MGMVAWREHLGREVEAPRMNLLGIEACVDDRHVGFGPECIDIGRDDADLRVRVPCRPALRESDAQLSLEIAGYTLMPDPQRRHHNRGSIDQLPALAVRARPVEVEKWFEGQERTALDSAWHRRSSRAPPDRLPDEPTTFAGSIHGTLWRSLR